MTQDAATSVQPPPHGTGPIIVNMVMRDISERSKMGKRKYGEELRAHNGRDAIADAYQECLDACFYLRQALYERDGE